MNGPKILEKYVASGHMALGAFTNFQTHTYSTKSNKDRTPSQQSILKIYEIKPPLSTVVDARSHIRISEAI